MAATNKMKEFVSSIMGTLGYPGDANVGDVKPSSSTSSPSSSSPRKTYPPNGPAAKVPAAKVPATKVPSAPSAKVPATKVSSAQATSAQTTTTRASASTAATKPAESRPRRSVASVRKITPVESERNCRRYLVLNGKGGCGKTTISTNLASYFAAKGHNTAIMDYDPQESSLTWLKLRKTENENVPNIHGIAAHPGAGGLVTRSWQLRTPPGTERVIVDAPAGTSGADLIEILKNVNAIVVPVLPSSIDMHATARFIQELLLVGKVRARNIPVSIVANRVPKQTQNYKKLLLFLSALNIPFVVKFKDNQHYLNAAEKGLGIHELQSNTINYEVAQWDTLANWLEDAGKGKFSSKEKSPLKR